MALALSQVAGYPTGCAEWYPVSVPRTGAGLEELSKDLGDRRVQGHCDA